MSDMKNGFRIIDHTADVGLEAQAPDLAQLFANAARGMFSIISSLQQVQPVQRIHVVLTAQNLEDLLVAWLSELLYLFSTRSSLFCDFEINEIDNHHLRAAALGGPIDFSRHELYTEIKAVTYHGLRVARLNQLWIANIIFDI